MNPLFVEMFPIATSAPLTAYRVLGEESVGGKLAYHLRLRLPGAWVWLSSRLITDEPPNPVELMMALDNLRESHPDTFGGVEGVEEDYGWRPDPHLIADFVVRGPVATLESTIRQALTGAGGSKLGEMRIERESRITGWEVGGKPALSISIQTRLVYPQELSEYAKGLKSNKELIGLWVADRTSTLRGEIVEVVGKLKKERARLIDIASREKMREILRAGDNAEPVVRVQTGRSTYDYTASALSLLITADTAERFGLDGRQVDGVLRLKPAMRASLVKATADVLKQHGILPEAQSAAFNHQNAPELFSTSVPRPMLRFGSGAGSKTAIGKPIKPTTPSRKYDPHKLGYDAAACGTYARLEAFMNGPIRAAVVNTLDEPIDDFIEALRRKLKSDFAFDVDLARERKIKTLSKSTLDSAIKVLEKEAPHLILIFMPDEDEDDDADFRGMAQYFRQLALARGMPCQVITRSTLHDPDSMPRVIVGVLGRTGNLPYVLDEPMPYCDYVAGIDVVRADEPNDDGTINVTAAARIYRNDGALIRYCAQTLTLGDDEALPLAAVSALFPTDDFGGKRIVLHREGAFSKEERALLTTWSSVSKITFLPVEVLAGSPRLYALEKGKVVAAPPGSLFSINAREALLVAAGGSLSPQAAAMTTPQPLHIRVPNWDAPFGKLSIAQAMESVQLMALMHYGTTHARLPVTLHRGEDLAAALADKHTIPSYSVVPFWL